MKIKKCHLQGWPHERIPLLLFLPSCLLPLHSFSYATPLQHYMHSHRLTREAHFQRTVILSIHRIFPPAATSRHCKRAATTPPTICTWPLFTLRFPQLSPEFPRSILAKSSTASPPDIPCHITATTPGKDPYTRVAITAVTVTLATDLIRKEKAYPSTMGRASLQTRPAAATAWKSRTDRVIGRRRTLHAVFTGVAKTQTRR